MYAISKWAIALTLLGGAAYAQLPSTNDASDGFGNTGMGTGALINDTPEAFTYGINNTASGYEAMYFNTTGDDNTAIGLAALLSNTSGCCNVATGLYALELNSIGSYNSATGIQALGQNTTGNNNSAIGSETLYSNSTGSFNTASGYRALYLNTIGNNNTASGIAALRDNTSGSYNIGVGHNAGLNVKTGSNNIEIGNEGTSSDNNVIKIGTEGTQAKTFIAGIYNTPVKGQAVMVDSSGQLGVVVSSERFKTAIAPMDTNTAKLQQLRPVTFKLISDATGTVQYGLIAEEVAKVYPELVVRDANGRVDGVRYDELAPMLLNEMQNEHATVATQAAEIKDLKRDEAQKIAAQNAEINQLKQQLAEIRAALITQSNKNELVAQH